ncbi:MAG: MFS transporter [Alphaproteobacteria bacterium]
MPSVKKEGKWPIIAGHVIECFDNTLYGFFAVMLAPLFFPTESQHFSLLYSYGAFAVGFISRPLGALFFGWLGDKKGRKQPLLWSLMLIGLPTIGIGIAPTYETIGIISPIILLSCRLAQGFLWGGEFAGASLYLIEDKDGSQLGRKAGILISFGIMGATAATLLGAVFTTAENTCSYMWRLPFILGGLCAFSLYFVRRKVFETQSFQSKREDEKKTTPLKELLKNHKVAIIMSVFLSGLDLMPTYLASIFGNRLFQELGYNVPESLGFNAITFITVSFCVIFTGRLADRIGFYRQMLLGCTFVFLFALPCFLLIKSDSVPLAQIILFVTVLPISGLLLNGIYVPYISSFFPVTCRYSGVALSLTTGQALFGGTAPLFASFLTDLFNTRIAPAFLLMFVSIMSFLLIYFNQKTYEYTENLL